MRKSDDFRVDKVLCNSGGTLGVAAERGEMASKIVERAAHMLDHSYLHEVIVVKGDDGVFYVGEFGFTFRKVGPTEARQVARDFAHVEE